jgi:4'-phosphopantetheinyl transferase
MDHNALHEAQHWAPLTNAILMPGAVHVWRVALQQPRAMVERLMSLLSADEQTRARRFRFERGFRRFVVAHAALRDILARYLARSPHTISFGANAYGKPHLMDADNWLQFNLSHSGEWALLAVTAIGPVGVDVEQVRKDFGGEEIARRFFSASEVDALLALPASLRTEAFFLCWTRKEAFIKAVGMGVSFPLESFSVSLHPHEPARVLWLRDAPQEVDSWRLAELPVGSGYVAALALKGDISSLQLWQWQTPQ